MGFVLGWGERLTRTWLSSPPVANLYDWDAKFFSWPTAGRAFLKATGWKSHVEIGLLSCHRISRVRKRICYGNGCQTRLQVYLRVVRCRYEDYERKSWWDGGGGKCDFAVRVLLGFRYHSEKVFEFRYRVSPEQLRHSPIHHILQRHYLSQQAMLLYN